MKKTFLYILAVAAILFSCGKEKQPSNDDESGQEEEVSIVEVTSIELRKNAIEMDR